MTYALVLRTGDRIVARCELAQEDYEQLIRTTHLIDHGRGLDVTAETPKRTYILALEASR